MSELNYVGKSVEREDSYGKVMGRTKFICDMKRTDMLYARLVLSEKAHSLIEVDTSEAEKAEGIVAVYTYKDVPKITYNAHKWYPGADAPEDQYILSDRARYMGDHLALVVGTSKQAVERGVSLVRITYTELPVITGIENAKKGFEIREGISNLAFHKTIECGNYEQAKAQADLVIQTEGSTQKIHHAALEPHICLCEIDETDTLVVYSPCQVASQIQYHISMLLKLPYSRIRVIKAVMGGSFGGKGQTVVEPACAYAAFYLKKPVMLYMDRSDAILATRSRNAANMQVETAVTKEGIIVGRKIHCEIDGGAYYTNAAAVAMALAKKLFRLYRIPSQRCDVNTYYTNTIPGGACRGYGSPQAHAVTEINLDLIARELGMDPCELRLKNLVYPMDVDLTGAPGLGNAQIRKCVEKGMKEFNWKSRRESVKLKNTVRYRYGTGMACGVHGNGYKGVYPDFTNVEIMLYVDGSIVVKISVHEQGCGTITTLQQIAAEALKTDISKVRILEADTLSTPYDSAGTQASRVTFVCGGAVKKAGEKLLRKIKKACKVLYQWENNCMEIKNGLITSGGITKTFGEVALDYEKRCSKALSIFEEYESPANPASYAVSFVEVRVDTCTGQVDILDCLAVHDIGRAVNRMLAEGQIEGGAHMSIGMALYENIDINESGVVKSRNFSKYHLLNAPDTPVIRTLLIEEKEPKGPYGAKSVGEIAAVTPAPAILNAINDALGTSLSHYPVTPEDIVEVLHG